MVVPISLQILRRGDPHVFLENFGEIGQVGETAIKGYFCDLLVKILNLFAGHIDPISIEVFDRGFADGFLKQTHN